MPDGDSSLCMPGASVVCLVTETAFGDRGFKTQSGWLGTRRREAFERGTPDGASLIYIYYVSVSCATVGDAHMSINENRYWILNKGDILFICAMCLSALYCIHIYPMRL